MTTYTFVTVLDAARKFGLSRIYVARLARDGRIRGATRSATGQWLIPQGWTHQRSRPEGPRKAAAPAGPTDIA